MALATFWELVRQRNPLFHEGVSPPDVPRVTADELDAELTRRPEAWCPHGLLKGYDEKDFDFLSPAEQARLSELVAEFNAVAQEVRNLWYHTPDVPKLAELSGRARPVLREIILILGQDRYRSPDALRFGKQVERELGDSLPEGVVELRCDAGEDSAGDPAIWVWAFLSDEATATDDLLVATGRRLRPILRAAARTAAPDHYPYILFRGISERVEAEVAT